MGFETLRDVARSSDTASDQADSSSADDASQRECPSPVAKLATDLRRAVAVGNVERALVLGEELRQALLAIERKTA